MLLHIFIHFHSAQSLCCSKYRCRGYCIWKWVTQLMIDWINHKTNIHCAVFLLWGAKNSGACHWGRVLNYPKCFLKFPISYENALVKSLELCKLVLGRKKKDRLMTRLRRTRRNLRKMLIKAGNKSDFVKLILATLIWSINMQVTSCPFKNISSSLVLHF